MGDITKEVKIYTYTNIKGPKKRDGVYGYILETQMKEKAATLTTFGNIENEAENGAELKTLTYALKRITQKCNLLIYTESKYVAAGFRLGWIENWKKVNWITAKKKTVANKEEWQELLNLLNGQQFDFKVKEEHEYRKWLQREVERIREVSE